MPDGGVLTLRSGEAPALADGRRAIFLPVTDTGTGIEEDALGRVFEPFFTTKSVGKGTGLGLSQVYGFAAQSGGDVQVDSAVGRGHDRDHDPSVQRARRRARGTARSPIPGGSIAPAGSCSSTTMRRSAPSPRPCSSELGHQVVRARTGAEALELARAGGIDAVFTDVVMPGMSGIELADALKPVLPGIPVVLTTGYSDEITRAGGAGRPVVFKPYRLETLAGVLDEVLAPRDR